MSQILSGCGSFQDAAYLWEFYGMRGPETLVVYPNTPNRQRYRYDPSSSVRRVGGSTAEVEDPISRER